MVPSCYLIPLIWNLTCVHGGSDVLVRATTQEKAYVISFSVETVPINFQYALLHRDMLLLGEPDTYLNVRVFGTVQSMTLAVKKDIFERYALAWTGLTVKEIYEKKFLAFRSPSCRAKLSQEWGSILTQVIACPKLLQDSSFVDVIEREVLEALLDATTEVLWCLPISYRNRVARSAEKYMMANLDACVSITDICKTIGCTERTLYLGFQEAFGMSPKRYLKALCLNAVRRDLCNPIQKATVTDIAIRWGFLHFGRFALYYRKMFEESPSQTLLRHRGK